MAVSVQPGLTQLLRDKIGDGFLKDGSELKKLDVFADDKAVLEQLRKIKKENKERFAKVRQEKERSHPGYRQCI